MIYGCDKNSAVVKGYVSEQVDAVLHTGKGCDVGWTVDSIYADVFE